MPNDKRACQSGNIKTIYLETFQADFTGMKGFKVSRAGGGDTAMALFENPDDVHEPYDAAEEKRLVRKIDWMILPYLAVCYAFL